ncbi:MAG: type II secretion system F family protein [Vulcanimicrobiota bacterium]
MAVTDSGARRLFDSALRFLVEALRADRALVLYGETNLEVKAAHGFNPRTALVGGPLSMALLERVRSSAAPLMLADARRDKTVGDHLSVELSGLRSVVCVPLLAPRGEVAGLLYGDSVEHNSLFGNEQLSKLVDFASRLERALFSGQALELPAAQAPKRRKRVEVAPASPAQEVARPLAMGEPSGLGLRDSSNFFRSLGLMVQTGLPIHRGLALLAEHRDLPALAGVSGFLLNDLLKGKSLSSSMERLPASFAPFVVQLVRAGENSGSLPHVLAALAAHQERSERLTLKLRSALTYPAAVLGVTLVLLAVGPPYLLKSQIQLIEGSGVALGWLTQALILASKIVVSPLFWGVAVAGLVGLAVAARTGLRNPDQRRRLAVMGLKVPLLGSVLRLAAVSRFASALSLQLKAGVLLADALEQAAQAAAHPLLLERMPVVLSRLKNGAGLAECLAEAQLFPRSFLGIIEAAESTASVPGMLDWVHQHYELEIDSGLSALTAALEPLVLGLVGGVVGLTVLASMVPVIKMLEVL